jgi:uncharacterized Rmd1/YagE family protein
MGECQTKTYIDNEVILYGSIVCWGFRDQPKCKFLKDCINDQKQFFTKRMYNKLMKELNNLT